MQAQVTLVEGMQFLAETESGHALVIDSGNPDLGGKDTGPRPMELVLTALCGCTAMDVISILRKMRQPVRRFRVRAEARQRPDHPHVFTHVKVIYEVEGEVDEKKVRKAVDLSQSRYCPVAATLRAAGVPVEVEIRISA